MTVEEFEDQEDIEDNISTSEFFSQGRETPAWLAGVGTYSVLVGYNKLVAWLSSLVNVPPAAILARDLALSVSNGLIGELVAPKIMTGPGVKSAIRFGWMAASLQTMATGAYEAWMKKRYGQDGTNVPQVKTVEQAKKLFESAKEDYEKAAKRLTEAQNQYAKMAKESGQLPAQDQEPQQKNVSGARRLSGRLSQKSSLQARKEQIGGFGM